VDALPSNLRRELAAVDEMLAFAERAALRPDARVEWLVRWIKHNMLSASSWNSRRLIIFTEWEDTRRWVQRRLLEALADTDRVDDRIAVFTGTTNQDRREEVKAAFITDPAKEPLRSLICTDAAREGINLQTYCFDLIHFDLPWNPSRLEQRNGRIDRKLQTATEMAEEGGLIGYGPRLTLIYRQLTRLIVKVLRGAEPKDLPVEQPTKFELVINLKTAKALGLNVPLHLQELADEVLE
jgi:superfamily II DNA/RNA helicase